MFAACISSGNCGQNGIAFPLFARTDRSLGKLFFFSYDTTILRIVSFSVIDLIPGNSWTFVSRRERVLRLTSLFISRCIYAIRSRIVSAHLHLPRFSRGCIIAVVASGNVGCFDEEACAAGRFRMVPSENSKRCVSCVPKRVSGRGAVEFFQSGTRSRRIRVRALSWRSQLQQQHAAPRRCTAPTGESHGKERAREKKSRAANCSLLRQISGRSLSGTWNYSCPDGCVLLASDNARAVGALYKFSLHREKFPTSYICVRPLEFFIAQNSRRERA